MIKIINENPPDLVSFMLQFLKEEEEVSNINDFKNALTKTITKRIAFNENMSKYPFFPT